MPHAKFRADPLKTVAVYKEQKHTDRQTDRHIRFSIFNLVCAYLFDDAVSPMISCGIARVDIISPRCVGN